MWVYNGEVDTFVAKLSINGGLSWHTFLGGEKNDFSRAIVTDGHGAVTVTGISTAAWGSPVRAFGGDFDAFVVKIKVPFTNYLPLLFN
jgi:hypothetical protein